MASVSSTGVIPTGSVTTSSIDVSSIVSQLMQFQSQPVTLLQNQQSSYQSQVSALQTLQGDLATFQSTMQNLSGVGQYQSFSATSSGSAVSASATTATVGGNYNLAVTTLAQAQSLVATGQTSATSAIGSGASTTLSINFGTISGGTLSSGIYSGATFTAGSGSTKTVTINSGNNTLNGIAAAINAANIGVSASVVNDGSSTPYRLVLNGPSGVANSMNISVAGDATLSSLLSENPAGTQDLSQTTAAQNAQLTVNGIAVTQASNTVTSAIQGVTFNLNSAGSSTVNVTLNSSGISSAVNSFVSAYNTLNSALQTADNYNASTKTASVLFGDPLVGSIQNQLQQSLDQPINGTTSLFSALSQIGVSFQSDGSLAVNSGQLATAISSSPGDIASLFSTVGKATDAAVSYTGATSATQAGTYALNVTQNATQGSLTGSVAAGLTISSGTNDTVNLMVDGTPISVTIPAGPYATAGALASEMQTLFNANPALAGTGHTVSVTANSGGILTVQVSNFGSGSAVALTGGNGSTNLLGSASVQTDGLDVMGTLNGVAATGSGQVLTSTSGASSGLSVTVNGGATGARGTVSYSQGYAVTLANLASGLLTTATGPVAGELTSLNSTITNLGNQITSWQTRLTQIQQAMTAQYSALNAMLGTMSQTSSYLTQQLSILH